MLVPLQTGGARVPLFLVHGAYGICPDSALDLRLLDPQSPFYAIHARGLDGAAPPCLTTHEMTGAYVAEIVRERPAGEILVGGWGPGSMIAIDIARELLSQGRRVGPVLMIEPSAYAHPTAESLAELDTPAEQQRLRAQSADAVRGLNAALKRRLFDADDPRQREVAAAVATATYLALARHKTTPFFGEIELILSADTAAAFFDPGHAWQSTLAGRRTVHVFDCDQTQLMSARARAVTRVVAAYLEAAFQPNPPQRPQRQRQARDFDRTGDLGQLGP